MTPLWRAGQGVSGRGKVRQGVPGRGKVGLCGSNLFISDSFMESRARCVRKGQGEAGRGRVCQGGERWGSVVQTSLSASPLWRTGQGEVGRGKV